MFSRELVARELTKAHWNIGYLTSQLDDALHQCANDEAQVIAQDLRLWQEQKRALENQMQYLAGVNNALSCRNNNR